MALFGFGKKNSYVVAVAHEGPGRLRLNGNRLSHSKIKKNAASHDQTVCWIEVDAQGVRLDQGTGPSATRYPNGEADRLLRDVPLSQAYRALLEDLGSGREFASKWYKLPSQQPAAS